MIWAVYGPLTAIAGNRTLIWVGKCDFHFPVEEFLRQRIWDGRTFWEAQEEMEWAGIPVLDNWIPESVASYLLFGGNFTGNVRS